MIIIFNYMGIYKVKQEKVRLKNVMSILKIAHYMMQQSMLNLLCMERHNIKLYQRISEIL